MRALVICIVAILGVETALAANDSLFLRWKCFAKDPGGFRINIPNQHSDCHRLLYQNRKLVLDTVAATDALGRRRVPQRAANLRAGRFLAFLGDSFTFGNGVTDSESYPAQIAALTRGWAVYNYGVSGFGPNNVLEMLSGRDLSREIPQHSGKFIYLWISDDAIRAVGALSHRFTDSFPDYELDPSGKPVLKGSFRSRHPIRYAVYDLLRKWGLGEKLHFDIPPRLTDADLRKVTALIQAIAEMLKRQIPDSQFYLVLWPQGDDPIAARERRAFERAFSASLIHVIRLDYQSKCENLPDGHPSACGYIELARSIVKELGIH